MAAELYKNRLVIWRPQPKQAAFMRRSEDEALYGGAAGGGKSDALVIEALRQVDIPHYRGLIVRKTYPQLSELIDKTMQYYKPVFPKARYNASSHVWTFPSGAKIYFGSMFRTQDKYNYQGKAFDFIGVDELTHFTWEEYSYLMSRNRPTGPHGSVHAGHGKPRRHWPRMGEGTVHYTGTTGHEDGAAGGCEKTGRQCRKAAADKGVYPVHGV